MKGAILCSHFQRKVPAQWSDLKRKAQLHTIYWVLDARRVEEEMIYHQYEDVRRQPQETSSGVDSSTVQ